MRVGFHGGNSLKSDLQTHVAAAAHAGFRILEVWAATIDDYLADHSLADMRELFASRQVEPAAMSSLEFIGFRGEEYQGVRRRCRELCEVAEGIGCQVLTLVPSPTPDRGTPWSSVVDEYVTVLRDLSEVAEPHGIRLGFEFLGFGWNSVRTLRGAYEIIQKTQRSNIGIVIDAAHVYAGGSLPDEFDLLDPTHVFLLHLDDVEDVPKEAITDSTRLLPGLGVIPLAEICARLRAIGYDGLCTVELLRPEYWEWDPCELAVQAREAALKVLSPFFAVE